MPFSSHDILGSTLPVVNFMHGRHVCLHTQDHTHWRVVVWTEHRRHRTRRTAAVFGSRPERAFVGERWRSQAGATLGRLLGLGALAVGWLAGPFGDDGDVSANTRSEPHEPPECLR